MKKENKDFQDFWIKKSKNLMWKRKPLKALKFKKDNYFSWFEDGKLNVADNCLEQNKKKLAIIFFSKDGKKYKISYGELNNAVDNICYYLKKRKLHKIKQVLIHAPASLESSVCMLAFSKLGIFFSVIFEELEKPAIYSRYKILKPDLIVTRSEISEINNKFSFVKNKKKILQIGNFDQNKIIENYKLDFNFKKKFNAKNFNGNKNMFCLFTSGSTGLPKGIVHSIAGYLLYAKITCKEKFGINSNSLILTASDAGWINGHTYSLFGPLSLGATTIILEKPILILNKTIFDQIIDLGTNIIYLPVTLIRILKAFNPDLKYRKNKIKCLGSMGEPLAPNIAKWFRGVFENKHNIVNTYFQTETGGILYSASHNDKKGNYEDGSCGKYLNKYVSLKLPKTKIMNKFELKLEKIWPGCFTKIINSNKLFQKYWDKNGYFKLFDIGSISKKGNLFVHGRNDDVLNIRGHRVGSGEIESVILKNNIVKEVSAVSVPDELDYEKLVLFISLKKKFKNLKKLNIIFSDIIKENFGSFAVPKDTFFISEIPKTRSGKILRRVMREIYINPKKNIGDTSTMLNPNIILEIKKKIIK